jgi:hypothetical protein
MNFKALLGVVPTFGSCFLPFSSFHKGKNAAVVRTCWSAESPVQ